MSGSADGCCENRFTPESARVLSGSDGDILVTASSGGPVTNCIFLGPNTEELDGG
jgi:hypothetical protein